MTKSNPQKPSPLARKLPPSRTFRLVRNLVFGFVAFLFVATIALGTIGTKQINALLTEKLLSAANGLGMNLNLPQANLTLFGFKADSVQFVIPKTIFSIELTNLTVNVSPLSLLSGLIKGTVSANAYDGTIDLKVNNLAATDISLEAKGVNVAKNTQLAALGVTGGLIDFTTSVKAPNSGGDPVALLSFRLSGGAKPAPSKFPFSSIPIVIPPIKDLVILADCSIDRRLYSCSNLSSISSLFMIRGEGQLTTDGTQPVKPLNLAVQLTDEGMKELGPWLPLISNQRLTATSKEFSVALSMRNGSVRAQIIP